MNQLKVKFFGTGDGHPCADRNHSAYLYQIGATNLLLDCGDGLCRSYKSSEYGFDIFDALLISHLHFDHVGGLFMLMQGLWLEKRRKPLAVHLPQDGIQPIRQMLDAGCVTEELLHFPISYTPWTAGQAVTFGDVRVTPFANTHLHGLKRLLEKKHPLHFESFSFLMESPDFRVVHSADIGEMHDLEPLLVKPVDLLVCELAHISPLSACQMLKHKNIRCIAFIHLGREQWHRFEDVKKEIKQILPDQTVIYPKDGELVVLNPLSGWSV